MRPGRWPGRSPSSLAAAGASGPCAAHVETFAAGASICTSPSSLRTGTSGRGTTPRRKRSTTVVTSWCTARRSLSTISMTTSNVGGAFRSSTVFCVPRAPRFLVGQRHGLDAADEVGERRVLQEVVQRVAVRRGDKLHAALGDGARREGLGLSTDLVDDDDLGHVVLHRLDHHRVLQLRMGHLHAPGAPDAGVRDVAVPGDLIARVYDDDAFGELVGEDYLEQ